jgi:predicted nucleic acid-binding protein
MAGKSGPKSGHSLPPASGDGVYIDSSALAKLYLPEAESEVLDRFLVGRTDLLISELGVTEVISAVARRMREGALSSEQANLIQDAIMTDSREGTLRRVDITPKVHRLAERILLTSQSIPFRTLDALHIALAVSGEAGSIVTFDVRMSEAAALHGLKIVKL